MDNGAREANEEIYRQGIESKLDRIIKLLEELLMTLKRREKNKNGRNNSIK